MKSPRLVTWAGTIVPIVLVLALAGSVRGQGPGSDEGVPRRRSPARRSAVLRGKGRSHSVRIQHRPSRPTP